ncbi:DNA polymerase III subunit chi [Leeia sp.]|uniref:DNA polymerase III subunit chi n=1 Tax=Leeia sp. TaxID=2884678 RepID=UPI0035B3C25C
MTQVDFYSPVADKLGFALRLCQKAYTRQWRVMFWFDDVVALQHCSHQLWTRQPTSFVAHSRVDEPAAADSPLLLAYAGLSQDGDLPHYDVLVNFSQDTPLPFARFARLVEMVGEDEADQLRCRTRFRYYREHGYPLQHHVLGSDA